MMNRLTLKLKNRDLVSKFNFMHQCFNIMEGCITEIEPPLHTTLASKLDEELLDYLLYLKSKESEITISELDFINRFLDFSFSLDRLNKLKKSKGCSEERPNPFIFNLALEFETKLEENNSLEITSFICEIYLEIGILFINLEYSKADEMDESMMKIKEYSDHFIEVIESKWKKGKFYG